MRADDDDDEVGAPLVDATLTSTEISRCVSESHKVPVLKFQYGRPMVMAAWDEDERRGERGEKNASGPRGLGCNAPENSNEESALV